MGVESFGTEREDIQGGRFQKLKMKTGDEIRCGIIYFDDDGKKMFLGTKVHVKPKAKTFLCKSTKSSKELCCTHSWEGNNSRYHIGCVIIIYNLGKENGKLKLKDYELIPWIFWEAQYRKLVSADQEFPLTKHDIKLKCTNDEYANIDAISCKESIWTGNPSLKSKVIEEAKPLYENISKNLGADIPMSEIKEIIGIEVLGSDDVATEVDMGTVIGTLE